MKRGIAFALVVILLASSAQAISIFVSDTLQEGEGRIYQTNLGSYIVKLVTVSDATGKVLFEVNNEKSRSIGLKDSFRFKDKSEIVVMDVFITDADSGRDEATFYFYGSGLNPVMVKNISYSTIEDRRCNFDDVCSGETQAWCCYDCGCDDGRCKNNKCVIDETTQVKAKKEETKDEPAMTITPKRKVRAVSVIIILLGIGIVIPFVYLIKQKKQRL